MGLFGKIGGALKSAATAPIKATGALTGGAVGATKALATGHPMQAGKKLAGGAAAARRPVSRALGRGRR